MGHGKFKNATNVNNLLELVQLSISKAVREVVEEYPALHFYLSRKLINYTSLAREIKPKVTERVGREVNLQSIVTALRRLNPEKREERLREILSQSEISLVYDLCLVTSSLTPETPRKVLEIHNRLEDYILLQGLAFITVITKEQHFDFLQTLFGEEILAKAKALAGVVVKSPEEIATTPGVISRLTSVISAEGINIVEMLSSYSETFFVVAERDALKCINAIRREMKLAK